MSMSKKTKRSKQSHRRLAHSRPLEQQISHAQHQMLQGDFAGAINTCEPLLNLLPRQSSLRVQVLALLGLAHGMLQHYETSYDLFSEALSIDPTNAELWYNHGLASRYTTRLARAVRDFERAVELSGNDTGEMARKFVKELEVSRKAASEAMQAYGVPITLDQYLEQEERFMRGMKMMKASKWQEAEQAFRQMIEMGGHLPQYWGNVGASLAMQHRYDEAEAAFKRALEIDPAYTFARNNLEKLPDIRQAGGPPGMEITELVPKKDLNSSITFYKNSDGDQPGTSTTIEKTGSNITRIRPQMGKQPPRYRFFLNPYTDTRFTTCPRCGYKTRPRKFSLFIRVDPDQPLLLDKICRFCYHCNLLIAHQDQLEDQLATFFSSFNPAIIGNFYEVIGTIDRSEWKRGKQDQFLMQELLEYLHDFKEVVTYEPVRA